MTATSLYLNHPVRTEREAQLEAALRRINRLIGGFDYTSVSMSPRVLSELLNTVGGITAAALSPTSNGGDTDGR